ncbi:MAG: NAD(P)-dependent alcohol dehydrogenase [Chloroflexota bacterium]|nr:NAD(P)-dependent alcohol dehydrogenase [Chloroflexota bacterium]
MKAIIYTEYGPPDVLHLRDVPKPTPRDNEVLIRVGATTVNRTDSARLRAQPFIMRFTTGLRKPRNRIPGTDFAGNVEAVGKDVKSLKVGDDVFGFDDNGVSSQAQYTTYPEPKGIATMPQNLSYEQAVACLEGAHYAYNFVNKVTLVRGQKVLVNGATGAIGAAAVQLLTYFGADVTAVCASENEELVRSLGATTVIDYTKEDFTKVNETYHYVFDTVGKSSFKKCKPLLQSGGIYMSSELGWMAQNLLFTLITPIFSDKKVRFPLPTNHRRTVLFVKQLCEEGAFRAVIDRNYPLEDIAEAYRYVETGQKIGNVVITIEHTKI